MYRTSEVTESSTASTLITSATTAVLALGTLRRRPVRNATKLVGLGVRGIRDVAELSAETNGSPAAL